MTRVTHGSSGRPKGRLVSGANFGGSCSAALAKATASQEPAVECRCAFFAHFKGAVLYGNVEWSQGNLPTASLSSGNILRSFQSMKLGDPQKKVDVTNQGRLCDASPEPLANRQTSRKAGHLVNSEPDPWVHETFPRHVVQAIHWPMYSFAAKRTS